jgi:hypothetical protein
MDGLFLHICNVLPGSKPHPFPIHALLFLAETFSFPDWPFILSLLGLHSSWIDSPFFPALHLNASRLTRNPFLIKLHQFPLLTPVFAV